MQQPDLRQYTIADLSDWLVRNKPAEGLSEQIIDSQRAWSIIHNPYVKDDDVVVSAIFEGDEMASFAACFPDMLQGERIWWFSTLYCRLESRGKGYGIIVMGSLCEAHEEERFFDMDGAQETVDVLDYLGLKETRIPRYCCCEKNIHTDSLKGMMAHQADMMRRRQFDHLRKQMEDDIEYATYQVRYVSQIDDMTYRFIKKHSVGDTFLREREMLNWILTYPFNLTSPIWKRAKDRNQFGSSVGRYELQGVQVWQNDILIGFFIYRVLNGEFAIKYLYSDNDYKQDLFLSIAEHFFASSCSSFKTTYKPLAKWINEFHLTGKYMVEKQSFSYPEDFDFTSAVDIQGGDGDTFV